MNGSELPGLASLSGYLDSKIWFRLIQEKILVVLRDGRKLIGTLRSYDQFANLVLQGTVERIYVSNMFGDISRGVFVVRGENLVMLGEVADSNDEGLIRRPIEQILAEQKIELENRERIEKCKRKILHQRGFSFDPTDNDIF
ncbi:U6 snRNA-associated Sm-like protein LSm1 [Rozella allomycis CSF55]|uniref:U6 snRNA-associated Sm-like protein LSm1 n=1 Tax=Rozella allomycis (strain CSF55) TaxID=988480 RepID=A0A4P9YBM3_ROZAC|nr:U6 snRNA-associated Sm-like protein LSm1 [Rozella allomycis CSF55]